MTRADYLLLLKCHICLYFYLFGMSVLLYIDYMVNPGEYVVDTHG